MKTKYPNLFGILAALMLVVSFVVPVSLTSPSAVQADPGMCKWDTLREPGALPGSEVVAVNTDPVDFAVGSDLSSIVAIVDETTPTWPFGPATLLKWSYSKGQTWTSSKYAALGRNPVWGGVSSLGFPVDHLTRQLYQVAIAPDNPNFWAVTSDGARTAAGAPVDATRPGPVELWVTQNAGAAWDFTNLASILAAGETIRTVDISVDYGGKRDIAVGTTTGAGGGRLLVVKSTGFSGWQVQTNMPEAGIDIFAVKFSPSYASDASLAVVFADNTTASTGCPGLAGVAGATYYNVQLRDIDQNATLGWAFTTPGIEVKDTTWPAGSSPGFLTLNKATLELPSDFSGQAASLRRAYISLDAMLPYSTCTSVAKPACDKDGIFRIDDTTVYTLMDTSNISDKSIYSIAYFGTYASGKLLAGERMGFPCTATVPTWFTDSPTTCPIPCWYPALKPTTGAACPPNPACCTVTSKAGVGAAIVHWAPQGDVAYVITGSKAYVTGRDWWTNLVSTPIGNDESAMGISRNNGETWNQTSLIDTTITQFTDIAPTPDCKTIYLASVNACGASTCYVTMSAN
ncbi:MAG: hypothetical protein WCD72_06805, partial [Dehalococcoidia bacterium]